MSYAPHRVIAGGRTSLFQGRSRRVLAGNAPPHSADAHSISVQCRSTLPTEVARRPKGGCPPAISGPPPGRLRPESTSCRASAARGSVRSWLAVSAGEGVGTVGIEGSVLVASADVQARAVIVRVFTRDGYET